MLRVLAGLVTETCEPSMLTATSVPLQCVGHATAQRPRHSGLSRAVHGLQNAVAVLHEMQADRRVLKSACVADVPVLFTSPAVFHTWQLIARANVILRLRPLQRLHIMTIVSRSLCSTVVISYMIPIYSPLTTAQPSFWL